MIRSTAFFCRAIALLGLGCSFFSSAQAQDFPGFRAGNYGGVNSVFFNPAQVADNRYKVDFNLFSIHSFAGNDQASFNAKDIFKNSFNTDSLRNQVFGKNAGPASGLANLTIHGPSLMLGLGRKTGIAFTTRGRVMSNIRDLDGKLADKILNDFANDVSLPYTINSNQNMVVNVHGWTEFGVSLGRVLVEKSNHYLKVGVTGKYLAGAANAHLNIGNLRGTIVETGAENFLTNSSGRIGLGFGGVNISDFEAGDLLKMESTGFGGDIGFIYEYRPDGTQSNRRDLNQYKFKLGVALNDVGKINYKRDAQRSGAYDISISNTEFLPLSELGDQDFDNFKPYFDGRPQFFTPVAGNSDDNYDVSLPTSLNLDLDLHLHRGFYLHAGALLSLAQIDNKPFNTSYYNGFSLTPRYEGRKFGVYVPMHYNELTSFNAGVSLRMGPLFIGSGSAITALFSDSKQADVHLGFRFGILQKKGGKKVKSNDQDAEKKEKPVKDEKKEKRDKTGGAATSIDS